MDMVKDAIALLLGSLIFGVMFAGIVVLILVITREPLTTSQFASVTLGMAILGLVISALSDIEFKK